MPSGTTLQAVAGPLEITEDKTTISGQEITGNVIVKADDVTIQNSKINGVVQNQGSNLTLDHVELDGSSIPSSDRESFAAVGYTNLTVRAANIHDFAQGVAASDGAVVEDSWIHTLRSAGQHADAIVSNGGANMAFRRNYLDSTWTYARHSVSGALAMYGDFAQIRQVQVTGNFLIGAGYLTYTGAVAGKPYPTPDNVAYVDNTFDTSAEECYGAVAAGPLDQASIDAWSGNRLATGEDLPVSAAISQEGSQ